MRLLVDMNLSPRWIGAFADAGITAAQLKTLSAILKAMGMRLAVQPIHEHA